MTPLCDAINDAFVEIAASIPEVNVLVAYRGTRREDGRARPIASTFRAIATEEDGAEEWGSDSAAPIIPRVWRLRVLVGDWPEVTPPQDSDEVEFRAMDGVDVNGVVSSLRRRFAYYELTVRKRGGA